MQTTKRGAEIPIPKRGDFLSNLKKVARSSDSNSGDLMAAFLFIVVSAAAVKGCESDVHLLQDKQSATHVSPRHDR